MSSPERTGAEHGARKVAHGGRAPAWMPAAPAGPPAVQLLQLPILVRLT